MSLQEEVKLIRFRCNSNALLGSENSRYYDVSACEQKYGDLCRDALCEVFPGAEIDIINGIDERTQVNGLTDHPAVDTIEQIRDRVFQSFKWEVPRTWLSAVEVRDRFSVPISVVRWACSQGLIGESEKVTGIWKFPQETFLDMRDEMASVVCNDVLELVLTDDGTYDFGKCHPIRVLESSSEEITEVVHWLVVPSTKLERQPWFTRDNFTLIASVGHSTVNVEIAHFADTNTTIETKWSYGAFAKSLSSQSQLYPDVHVDLERPTQHNLRDIDSIRFRVRYEDQRKVSLSDLLSRTLDTLAAMARDAELELAGGPIWRKEYETDERMFRQEVLGPLLRRMGFQDVSEKHGVTEAGKDFVFSEVTKFGDIRHGALQAKAGNVSGRVNSNLNVLLGQIEDAFENPYHVLGDPAERWISMFIIAISGSFTEQAKEKIRNKIRNNRVGSVYFLDKERILELLHRYWSAHR